MINHIVLFKLKDGLDANFKANFLTGLQTKFYALMGQIPTLRSIQVGINCNPAEKFDLSLFATFDDMAGLEVYAKHPLHVAVGAELRQHLDARSCVNYQV